MLYPSKRDKWIVLLILPAFVYMIGAGLCLIVLPVLGVLPPWLLISGVSLLATGGFLLWCFLSSSAEITTTDLIVRFGPARWTVPLENITAVEPKVGLSADWWVFGLAWSTDRVLIRYRKRNGRPALFGLAISPRDKNEFLDELADKLTVIRDSQGTAQDEGEPNTP